MTERVRVCACVCVCVRMYVCLRKCVRACVCVVSRASPILTRKRMHVQSGKREERKNTSKQTFQVFLAALYAGMSSSCT